MNFTTIGIYVEIVGDDGAWEYAQGFWMTICSAVLSTVCALLLSLNSFILPEFGKRGKMGLSGSQRVFVIQIMLFIFWLAVYVPLCCRIRVFPIPFSLCLRRKFISQSLFGLELLECNLFNSNFLNFYSFGLHLFDGS